MKVDNLNGRVDLIGDPGGIWVRTQECYYDYDAGVIPVVMI